MIRFQSYKGKNDVYPGISMMELNPLEKKTRLASDEKVITLKAEHFNLLIIHTNLSFLSMNIRLPLYWRKRQQPKHAPSCYFKTVPLLNNNNYVVLRAVTGLLS